MSHWVAHPHVRTGKDLTLGERAADHLKRGFGSWPFLIVLNVFIGAWMLWNVLSSAIFDPYPWLALNIILSWLAAQQGGALQIAANRGDRIASEVAMGTHENSQKLLGLQEQLLDLQQQQMEILDELRELRKQRVRRPGG
jgi:uncharacterized membrane protein